MKAIAYSLFGYGETAPANSFEFECYARGLMTNVRFNRILYPNWINVLNLDQSTYESKYRRIFDWLQNEGFIRIVLHQNGQPLCRKMLWRLSTVFSYTHPEWDYTHVLNRDIDSIATYREAQAVQQWIQEGKAAHGITDSISHNIPLMGGMIGFKPGDLSSILGVNSYDDLIKLGADIDFTRKGADQTFLNRVVYPKVARAITEHFVLGMRHDLAEEDGRHYSIPNVEVEGVPIEYREVTNACCGHVGSSGYYEPPTLKFLNTIDPYRDDYGPIEKAYPKLFFWRS